MSSGTFGMCLVCLGLGTLDSQYLELTAFHTSLFLNPELCKLICIVLECSVHEDYLLALTTGFCFGLMEWSLYCCCGLMRAI
jgi:hypothetical protein